MIGACGLGTHTFRVACEDARGLRAGALIAALGGLCAERRAIVPTTKAKRPLTKSEADATMVRIEEKVLSIARLIDENLARIEPRIKRLEKAAGIKKAGDA
jgi:hypothetical protein